MQWEFYFILLLLEMKRIVSAAVLNLTDKHGVLLSTSD